MRKISLLVALFFGGTSLMPVPASACAYCDFYGIACGRDECYPIMFCESASGPGSILERTECYEFWGNCYTAGAVCSWAAKPAPAEDSFLSAWLEEDPPACAG